jgi:hypothetical protein
MKLQSHALRVCPFAWTRWVVSSASTIPFSEISFRSRWYSGSVSSAQRWNRSPNVESFTSTPARRYAFA